MFRWRPVLIGMAGGLVAALLTLFLWEAIPRETFARRVWDGLFFPEYFAVDHITDWLSPHNRDQGIRYWMIIHPVYCAFLGGLIGLGSVWRSRCRHKRSTT
jgi:hypothetical protein